MTLSNIDEFDETTGRVFARLYENFPRPIALDASLFLPGGMSSVYAPDSFTGAELTPSAEAFVNTVAWLIREGYISSRNRSPTGFSDAVLTEKGLAALRALPKSLTGDTTIGDWLVQSVKSGAKEVVKSVANEALNVFIKTVSNF